MPRKHHRDAAGRMRTDHGGLEHARSRDVRKVVEGPEEVDKIVLDKMNELGADLTKLHTIEFFVYVHSEEDAYKASARMQESGFVVEVCSAESDEKWLCLATKRMTPEFGELERIRKELTALAESLNGEFDGWGTLVEE